MGWASAGAIFDPIAQALIDEKASVELKRKVLVKLINVLCDGDWDTEGESLDAFRHDPVIVSAFYTALEGIELGDYESGRISFDDDEDSEDWVVECRRCGVLGREDARLDEVESSVNAHNGLIRLWVDHDKERHGGDGEVPEWDLIGGDPEGLLDLDEETNEWVMRCDSCGELGRGDGDSAKAHNELVVLWAKHCQEKHNGDGRIPERMLIDAEDGDDA